MTPPPSLNHRKTLPQNVERLLNDRLGHLPQVCAISIPQRGHLTHSPMLVVAFFLAAVCTTHHL